MRQYRIDSAATFTERLLILSSYSIKLGRWAIYRLLGLRVKGPSFLARGIRFENSRKFSSGRRLSVGTNVVISCFVRESITFGDNCTIKDGAVICGHGVLTEFGQGLTVGDSVGISEGVIIFVRGKIEIGCNTIIGPRTMLIAENHRFDKPGLPIKDQGTARKGIQIGRGVWIGAGVVILDGVMLGDGCVVAAGSVVNKSFEGGSVIGGVPAKLIRQLERKA